MLTPSTETVEIDRVPERVADEHAPLGQPLRARGRDVVRLEHLEQRRAQAADQDRRDRERDGQRRQEHRVQVARGSPRRSRRPGTAGRGAAPKTSRQHDPDPERREAEADERHGADGVVGRRGRVCVAAIAASGTAISDREQRRRGRSARASPAAGRHQLPAGDAVEERRAEVAVREPLDELLVLHGQRPVEAPARGGAARRAAASRWLPRIVARRVAGTRWIRKKTRIVTPSATGPSAAAGAAT